MLRRHCIALLALTAGLMTTTGIVQAQDMSKYPDWAGQWRHADPGNQFDNSKGKGRLQQAPLTSEYQALFEAGEADQAAGGQGNDPTYTCIPDGMPRAMNVIFADGDHHRTEDDVYPDRISRARTAASTPTAVSFRRSSSDLGRLLDWPLDR